MTNKWQQYIAITVIVLVVLLILMRLVYNYKTKDLKWKESDNTALVSQCLDDLGGRSVIYPSESTQYCECTSDIILAEFSKKEYLIINAGEDQDGASRMTSLLAECNNAYQEAMFNASKID